MKKLSKTKTNNYRKFSKNYNLPMLKTPAVIKILREKQQPPEAGNDIIAKAVLLLPCQSNNDLLLEIQFQNKLEIFSENLNSNWGVAFTINPYRRKKKLFTASTWEESFNSAMDYTKAELDKLIDALKKRQKALQDAEPKQLISELQLRELEKKRTEELKQKITLHPFGNTYYFKTRMKSNVGICWKNKKEDTISDTISEFKKCFDVEALKEDIKYATEVLNIVEEVKNFKDWKAHTGIPCVSFTNKTYPKNILGIEDYIYEAKKRISELREPIHVVPENLKHLL